ncbi:hypothetical protein ACYSNU_16850 [Enterococcus sp. LJL120]
MKGLIITLSRQANNSIMWTMQDQFVLPRLKNYLELEYPQYEWEEKPFYEVDADVLADYQIAALSRLAEPKRGQVMAMKPGLEIVEIPPEEAVSQMAFRGDVLFKTSGYLLAEGPKLKQKGQPTQTEHFHYQNLQQLMRDYPYIYWEVSDFESIKEILRNKPTLTVGLAPAAYAYNKFFSVEFPEAKIIKIAPKALSRPPKIYDKIMAVTLGVTLLLMGLLVLFT